MSFKIVTEACANIPIGLIKKHDIRIANMSSIINGKEFIANGKNPPEEIKGLYSAMREGADVKTSCAPKENFIQVFTEILENGEDILYIGFSEALSASYTFGNEAANELREKYPDRKILVSSSLAASMGHALLVTYAAEQKEAGKPIEEVYAWQEENKLRLQHLFTVENLKYLYRGGRLKKTSYLLASTLNIKPTMHVDDQGRLTAYGKVFGRKSALSNLASKTAELIENPEEQTIYITHGDCMDDVDFLIAKIKENGVKVKDIVVDYLDIVIGAHAGPGTIAVFFLGKSRKKA